MSNFEALAPPPKKLSPSAARLLGALSLPAQAAHDAPNPAEFPPAATPHSESSSVADRLNTDRKTLLEYGLFQSDIEQLSPDLVRDWARLIDLESHKAAVEYEEEGAIPLHVKTDH